MLTFNTVLREFGLNPDEVLLVRHSGEHMKSYDAWRTSLPVIAERRSPIPLTFEQYQQHQKKRKFRTKLHLKYWASFITTPSGDTMFIGIYKRIGKPSPSAFRPD